MYSNLIKSMFEIKKCSMRKMLSQSFLYLPMVTSNVISKLILFLFLLLSSIAFSQPPPPFSDDVNDEIPLPIDSHLIVLSIVGAAIGFNHLKITDTIENIKL